ncbi:hypothetical protein DFP72DRAFT_844136 [Ephemerocybe angulata]|uniref:Uncharacterized protein n=1 Tax=Ephemerocybe angulata TaxID=980116 RepID=A0A8H6I7M9_9AGAR|nr:hypothetical protein DFP72DRAFT_844136 [Tulosesus angulatus]
MTYAMYIATRRSGWDTVETWVEPSTCIRRCRTRIELYFEVEVESRTRGEGSKKEVGSLSYLRPVAPWLRLRLQGGFASHWQPGPLGSLNPPPTTATATGLSSPCGYAGHWHLHRQDKKVSKISSIKYTLHGKDIRKKTANNVGRQGTKQEAGWISVRDRSLSLSVGASRAGRISDSDSGEEDEEGLEEAEDEAERPYDVRSTSKEEEV